MNLWFLLVQLLVGGYGGMLFLSALADAFTHEEHLRLIRKRQRELEHAEADGLVLQVHPQPEAVSVPPAR